MDFQKFQDTFYERLDELKKDEEKFVNIIRRRNRNDIKESLPLNIDTFKIAIHYQLYKIFSASGNWYEQDSNGKYRRNKNNNLKVVKQQWNKIFHCIAEHAELDHELADREGGRRRYTDLNKGESNTEISIACYYWMHTFNEDIGKGEFPYKKNAHEIDKIFFGQELDIKFEHNPWVSAPDTTSTSSEDEEPSPPSSPYALELSPPPVYKGNINYFGTKAIEIFGREDEKSKLRDFLNCDDEIAWYQIAGVAGQGKSRLALYLTEYATDNNWEAGFIDQDDFEDFSKNWHDWHPLKPYLFVFDYVIGREHEISSFFGELSKRTDLKQNIRVLLVERQPWDKGGFQRPILSSHKQQGDNKNVLELSESFDREENAEWFKTLCTSKNGRTSTKVEIYLNNTRFNGGVLELKEIKDDNDLFSMINEVIKHEKKAPLHEENKINVIQQLEHIDPARRPLYAYLFGQTFADDQQTDIKTRDDLLKSALNRQREKRWKITFPDQPSIWSDDNPAYRLAVLATITKGLDCKEITDQKLSDMQNADTRHKAMVLTDTPVKSVDDPGVIILPLEPDLLGEWMVLDGFNNYLPIDQVMDLAWQYHPKGTAAFLLRLVQDFSEAPVTEKLLQHELPCSNSLSELSEVSRDILSILYEKDQTNKFSGNLIKALEFAAGTMLDPKAMTGLAWCYSYGNGVEQSDNEAVKWYRQAADKDVAGAMFNLGVCYKNGRGVGQSDDEAVTWYRKAAEKDDTRAMTNLGVCYENGRGVEQSDEEAVTWFRQAADKDDARAMTNLGLLYANGRGVEQSDEEAVTWFRQAADKDDTRAMTNLGLLYANGRGVEQSDEEAVKWYRQAADKDDANAMFNLGLCYAIGRGVEQSDEEAVKWYRQAADKDDATGMTYLGVCYENGRGVEQSDEEAVTWYRKAAEKDDATAMTNLGVCYENGRGVEQSDEEAVAWYRQAADKDDASAMFNLGWCYQYGRGVEQSDEEAVKWYRQAEKLGSGEAKSQLMVLNKIKNLTKDTAEIKTNNSILQIKHCDKAWLDSALIFDNWKNLDDQEISSVLSYIEDDLISTNWNNDLHNLECNGIRYCSLGFYPDYKLIDAQFTLLDTGETMLLSAILGKNGLAILDGESPLVHKLNARLLELKCEQAAIDYLRFFCEFVRGEERPFHIISDFDDIPFANSNLEDDQIKHLKSHIKPLQHVDSNFEETGYQNYSATVLYSNALFSAFFKVHKSGNVEMLDDNPIAGDLPVLRRKYNGIFRTPLREVYEQSDEEIVTWYRQAAEKGDARAMTNLGVCYENGHGVEQSDEEAVKWYRQAADKGYAHAMFNLGVSYIGGQGVEQSDDEAVKWFRKAADKSNANAMFNLGVCYENGRGVEQNDEEAVTWYRKAEKLGSGEAKSQLMVLNKIKNLTKDTAEIKTKSSALQVKFCDKTWLESVPLFDNWKNVNDQEISSIIYYIEGNLKKSGWGNHLHNLECNGIRYCYLDFYADYKLIDAQFKILDTGETILLSAILGRNGVVLLDGQSPLIQTLTARFLKLENEQAIIDYLRFFCEFVRGEEGPFHIISDFDDIPFANSNLEDGQIKHLKSHIKPLQHVDSNFEETGYQNYSATVLYSDALFSAVFKVHKSGIVEMLDDNPIAADLPVLRRKYNGIFRTPLQEVETD